MKIPQYQRQVQEEVKQAPQPSQTVLNAQNQVRQANQQLGQSVADIGTILQKRAEEKQTQEVIDAETSYRKDMSDLLTNKDKGLMATRLYGKADGVTGDFDTESAKIRQKYESTFQTAKQKQAFAQMIDKYTQANRDSVVKFEVEEINKGKLNSLEANHSQSLNDVASNPSMLETVGTDAANKYTVIMGAMGYDKATIDQQIQKSYEGLGTAAINACLVKGDIKGARTIYDTNKEKFGAAMRNETEKVIIAGEEKNKGEQLNLLVSDSGKVQDVSQFATLKGNINKTVDSMTGLSDEAKTNMKRKYTSQAVSNQVDTILANSKQPEVDGPKFLQAHKGDIDPTFYEEKLQDVENKTIDFKADALFKSNFKSMTFADGTIDLKRVDASLEKKYSGDDLQKMKSAIHSRIGVYNQDLETTRTQVYNEVLNGVDSVINKKGGYGQALGVLNAQKRSMEPHDYKRLKDYIDSEYKVGAYAVQQKKEENVAIKSAQDTNWMLQYMKISSGQGNIPEINDWRKTGKINDTQWKSLMMQQISASKTADKESMAFDTKQKVEYINRRAIESGYVDKKGKVDQAYVNYMTRKTSNMSFTQAVSFVESESKDQIKKNAGWFWTDKNEGPKWQIDSANEYQQSKKWDTYNKYFGVGAVENIKYNLQAQSSGGTLDVADMDKFVSSIGGMNADTKKVINDLTVRGVPLTVQAVNNGVTALKRDRAKKKGVTGSW